MASIILKSALEAKRQVNFESELWQKIEAAGRATIVFLERDPVKATVKAFVDCWDASALKDFCRKSSVFTKKLAEYPQRGAERATRSTGASLDIHLVYRGPVLKHTRQALKWLVLDPQHLSEKLARHMKKDQLDDAELELRQYKDEVPSLEADFLNAWEKIDGASTGDAEDELEDSPSAELHFESLVLGMSKTSRETAVWALEQLPAKVANKLTREAMYEFRDLLGIDENENIPEFEEIPPGCETDYTPHFAKYLSHLGGKVLIIHQLSQGDRTQLRALLQMRGFTTIITGNTDIIVLIRKEAVEEDKLRVMAALWELKTSERAVHPDLVGQVLLESVGATNKSIFPVLSFGGDAYSKVVMVAIRGYEMAGKRRLVFDVYGSDAPEEALPLLLRWVELASKPNGLPPDYIKGHELLKEQLTDVDIERMDLDERLKLEAEENKDRLAQDDQNSKPISK